ncbi:TIGR00374 family protein [Candidatus Parcubacteria bacterium]|nr:MAG: TIGR00374 family protein [Candidatus Parcubacteria bacterium]
MNLKKRHNYLIRLIGIVLFALIIKKIGISHIIDSFQYFNLKILMISVPAFFLIILLKALRWILLIRTLDRIRFKYMRIFMVYLQGYFAGAVTPGRFGEFIKYRYVHREGVPLINAFISVLGDRLFDVGSLVFLAYISMFLLFNHFKHEIITFTFLIFISLSALAIIYKKQNIILPIFFKLLKKIFHFERTKDIDPNVRLSRVYIYQLLAAGLLSLCGWMIYSVQMLFISDILQVKLSLLEVVICISISSLITLIPISFAGIGTREASLLIVFYHLGLSKENAVVFSLCVLSIYFINCALSMPFWFWKLEKNRLVMLGDGQNRIQWNRYWGSCSLKKKIIEFFRNAYFARYFSRQILKFVNEGPVLEAGCGTGRIAKELERHSILTVCVDISFQALMEAKTHCINCVKADILHLPFKSGSFNAVYNQGVMEHFDPESVRKICREVKRVSGQFIVIVPSQTSIFRWLYNPFSDLENQNVFWTLNQLRLSFADSFTAVSVKYLPGSFFLSMIGCGR